jgi:hypothetical protein
MCQNNISPSPRSPLGHLGEINLNPDPIARTSAWPLILIIALTLDLASTLGFARLTNSLLLETSQFLGNPLVVFSS